jgi:succinoglycan biosynthesis transport protein ExoP
VRGSDTQHLKKRAVPVSLPNTTAPDVAQVGSANQALEYFRALWKRKWLVLLVAIMGTGAAYAWTLRQPRIYRADCTLQYDPNPPKPLGREVEDVANNMYAWETREYFATQNKIIASRTVAEKVVRKLSLHENADFWSVPPKEMAGWKRATITDTARRLQAMITVSQERDTRLVHILVQDHNRDRAMLLANSVADAYIEKTMEDRLGATTGALEWLGTQLDSLKRQLEQSELALHEFSEQHTNLAVSLEDQQNIVASTIQQLSHSLTDTKTKRIELAARVQELAAANVSDPMQVHAGVVMGNPAVTQLRERYRSLLTERDALVVHYGDAHPKIVGIDAQLATLKLELRAQVDGLIGAAQSELNEVQHMEKGMQGALDQANRVGLELNLQEISHRRLQRERDNTAKLYGTLLERTAQTDLTRALQVSYVRLVDQALVPRIPISPRVNVALAIGTLLGLMLAIGIAIALDQLDRVIRTGDEAEALGITVLGVLPHIEANILTNPPMYGRRKRRSPSEPTGNRDLIVHNYPKSSVAECCRTIRTNLTFMSADRPRKTIVVTSASPREGKTTVTMSLAISLAQSGKRILVVDTDLRRPRLHRALGKTLARGVTSVLVGEHTVQEAIQETDIPNLSVLASGPIPPNPSELLHTDQFRQLITDLAKNFDHVILDSPPLAAVTDASIIAPQVDSTILVIHAQRTTRDAVRSALRQLRDVNVQLTGGVLNEVDLSAQSYGAGSYYYYRNEAYYQADSNDDDEKRPPRPVAQA